MSIEPTTETNTPINRETSSPGKIRIVLGLLTPVVYMAFFFFCAGRIAWWQGWTYLGLMVGGIYMHSLYLARHNPELRVWRRKIGVDTKKWDKVWLVCFGILYMAILFVAALDAGRFNPTPLPLWTWGAGCVMYIVSLAFTTWAMSVNPHFEKTVRIQHDRGHKVIEVGPYRIVRHPGYVGTLVGFVLAPPLLLGSYWAFIPSGITALWIVVRTHLEDRTLRAELEGYEAYTGRVPYRLIPFIW